VSGETELVLGNRDSVISSRNQTGRGAGRPPDARRQEQRRSEILEAATAVFARVGFADTDVQEIAALAGVGKGTVYRYFPSKEELFLATVDLGMRRLTTTVDSAASKAAEPFARIAAAIEAYLAYFDQHPEMIELFIQERAHFRHRQQATYFAHHDANIGAPIRDAVHQTDQWSQGIPGQPMRADYAGHHEWDFGCSVCCSRSSSPTTCGS
jgi:AcrR family transcriptional regulator